MSLKMVNDLKSRIGDLERKLAIAKQEYVNARHKYLSDKIGIKVGDKVSYKGKIYFFSRFDDSDYLEWGYGFLEKKDGQPSLSEKRLYSDFSKVS